MSKIKEMRHTWCLCQKSSKNMDCRNCVSFLFLYYISLVATQNDHYIYVYGNIFFPSDVDKEWKECEYFS